MGFNTLPQNFGEGNNLPWANDYLESNQKQVGKLFDVTTIKQTKKGLIIETNDFAAFLFKSKELHDYLLEFCKAWYDSRQSTSVLQVQLSSNLPHVLFGTEDTRRAYWGKTEQGSYYQTYAKVTDNPEFASNPLPLPSPSTASTTAVGELELHLLSSPTAIVSTESPLEEPTTPLNGTRHTKTPKKGQPPL